MCSLRRPAHLLLLDHPLAHHLVDGRLDEGARDRLPVAIPLAVVRYPGPVGANVAAELDHGLQQLALLGAGVLDVEVHLEVPNRLQRAEDVAVPEEPLPVWPTLPPPGWPARDSLASRD